MPPKKDRKSSLESPSWVKPKREGRSRKGSGSPAVPPSEPAPTGPSQPTMRRFLSTAGTGQADSENSDVSQEMDHAPAESGGSAKGAECASPSSSEPIKETTPKQAEQAPGPPKTSSSEPPSSPKLAKPENLIEPEPTKPPNKAQKEKDECTWASEVEAVESCFSAPIPTPPSLTPSKVLFKTPMSRSLTDLTSPSEPSGSLLHSGELTVRRLDDSIEAQDKQIAWLMEKAASRCTTLSFDEGVLDLLRECSALTWRKTVISGLQEFVKDLLATPKTASPPKFLRAEPKRAPSSQPLKRMRIFSPSVTPESKKTPPATSPTPTPSTSTSSTSSSSATPTSSASKAPRPLNSLSSSEKTHPKLGEAGELEDAAAPSNVGSGETEKKKVEKMDFMSPSEFETGRKLKDFPSKSAFKKYFWAEYFACREEFYKKHGIHYDGGSVPASEYASSSSSETGAALSTTEKITLSHSSSSAPLLVGAKKPDYAAMKDAELLHYLLSESDDEFRPRGGKQSRSHGSRGSHARPRHTKYRFGAPLPSQEQSYAAAVSASLAQSSSTSSSSSAAPMPPSEAVASSSSRERKRSRDRDPKRLSERIAVVHDMTNERKDVVDADDWRRLRRDLIGLRKSDPSIELHGSEHRSDGSVAIFCGNDHAFESISDWIRHQKVVPDKQFLVWDKPIHFRISVYFPVHLHDEAEEVLREAIELNGLEGSFKTPLSVSWKTNDAGKEFRVVNWEIDSYLLRSLLQWWDSNSRDTRSFRLPSLDSSVLIIIPRGPAENFLSSISVQRAAKRAHRVSPSPTPSPSSTPPPPLSSEMETESQEEALTMTDAPPPTSRTEQGQEQGSGEGKEKEEEMETVDNPNEAAEGGEGNNAQ